jgi:SAM-dependent methyltransferase
VKGRGHGHAWIAGVLGVGVGLTLLVVMPRLKAIAGVALLFGLFHLLGLGVLLGSLYALSPARARALLARRRRPVADGVLDYGWSFTAMNGHWLIAAALGALALGLQIAWPWLWPCWLALALLAGNTFIGGLLLRSSKHPAWATLPLVDLLRSDRDLVLDGGCGAGRTTIALSRVLRGGRVVAVDRFDADYIVDGGRALLERNLRVAGIADRVSVERADLTALPFADGHFDAAVSAHAIDHLGKDQLRGLAEVARVLRPGGRFLLAVWVSGWGMLAVANLFCLLLTSRAGWRDLAARAGLRVVDQGTCNHAFFLLLEKPG